MIKSVLVELNLNVSEYAVVSRGNGTYAVGRLPAMPFTVEEGVVMVLPSNRRWDTFKHYLLSSGHVQEQQTKTRAFGLLERVFFSFFLFILLF